MFVNLDHEYISEHTHSSLISTGLLSWVLGLRHAFDADHISAIDLMTRRLLAAGQRPGLLRVVV